VWQFKIHIKPYRFTYLACGLLLGLASSASFAEVAQHDTLQASADSPKNIPNESNLSSTEYLEVSLAIDYRRDSFNWNEAGSTVNILSELKWENLNIVQLSAAANVQLMDNWIMRSKLDYGSIISGNNQDSDYNGNNRTLEFSRSNNKGGGYVRDGDLAFGYVYWLFNQDVKHKSTLTPLIGYSIHQQNLQITDGFQTVPATGTYANLDSSYDAEWLGPWLGIESNLLVTASWSVQANLEYHWSDYSAHANWNLRSEFSHPISFTHTAQGHGVITYVLNKNWLANVSWETQNWQTEAGSVKNYFSNGTISEQTLNEVNWISSLISLRTTYCF
jgi:hypothetical protein